MPMKVYKQALKLVEKFGETISIGGGEPTVHPQFWQYLGLALGTDSEYLWMATNGKKTDDAIKLARMARKGILGVALSQDVFHEELPWQVEDAFKAGKEYKCGWFHSESDHDLREIRDVSQNVINVGRAKRNQLGMNFKDCVCDDLFCDPDGNIFSCGCKKEKFGTVFKPAIPDEYWERGSRCPKENRRYLAKSRARESQIEMVEA